MMHIFAGSSKGIHVVMHKRSHLPFENASDV